MIKYIFILLVFIELISCHQPIESKYDYPKTISLQSDFYKIIAEDKSFTISPNQKIGIPFRSSNYPLYGDIQQDYGSILNFNAKKILIINTTTRDTVYGIFYLGNKITNDSSQTTNYDIVLPTLFESNLIGDEINYFGSFVKATNDSDDSKNKEDGFYAWAIWVSKKPIKMKPPTTIFIGDRKWKVGNSFSNERQVILELYPNKEGKENWTEQITFHYLFGLEDDTKLNLIADKVREKLQVECPNLKWNYISQYRDKIIYDYQISNCYNNVPIYEIGILVYSPSSIFYIRYDIKTENISLEKKEELIQSLKKIKSYYR